MKRIQSCIIAFAMYSKIPMPKVEWTKENMRYSLCFFPLVGVVIAIAFFLWGYFGKRLAMGSTLYTAVLVLIPVIVTGGIHLDGLLDTADALSSFQSKERRLEILKDSHAGAFAIIVCCVYFLAYFGAASELPMEALPIISLGFVLSRALSGYAVIAFTSAKTSGLAATFADRADKKQVGHILCIQMAGSAIAMILMQPMYAAAAIVAALLTFLYYRWMSYKKFGGVTGDLAGFFLQICELCMLVAVVFVAVFVATVT
ncbi:adenosylcobinamide-GDP ribazoletransferase [Lachnospiraceae bacterium ZAX-1]